MNIRLLGLLALVLVGSLGACALRSGGLAAGPSAVGLDGVDLSPVAASDQVLVVVAEDDSQHARAWLLERGSRAAGGGTPALRVVMGPMAACVGAKGFAPPGKKREGDKRSPTGAFALAESYSSGPGFVSKLPHRVVTEQDMICEDPASPEYNRWVRVEGKSLPAWTSEEREMMELGLIVDYNRDPVVPGAGSGILVHAAKPGPGSAGTYGCVGLSKGDLRAVVSRLDGARRPMVLMGRRVDLRAAGR